MTAKVIKFQRYKDVTHLPLYQVREWCRANGWVKGFRIDWRRSGEHKLVIERLR